MATSNIYENVAPCKTCRCGDGDTNIWTTRTSDNPDKQVQKCPNCQVLKSGPLFLSSRGIGWTSWKKRWFILTRTSLVFYRSDPNATLQKGSEANLALGGIDLNNSGSVVVKADKKLLTVFFPDGRDGKTFTLKAETPEDLHEWKTALENALAVAPSPASALGQNGTSHSDVPDSLEASFEQWRDRRPSKSSVVGRPILLALEDIDGSPSFLEKALRFIEEYGIKVEGILRQAADVEEVERRVREYEQGIVEFTPDEDAHVVGDCIKHILRELPSSPVPATCCTALVEAYKTDRGSRITAMRAAVAETFPEPNRRLVQRILKMMRTVASHKSENRMTLSAVAACMAPLLLRPLLAGDCELEDDFNMGGDGSMQLLQAAAAANHAQAIVIILLEEYERIFDEDSLSSDIYSESEEGDVDDDELTDSYVDDDDHNGSDHALEADIEDDQEGSFSGTLSECNSDLGSDLNKASDDQDSYSSSLENEDVESTKTLSNTMPTPLLQKPSMDISISIPVGVQENDIPKSENRKSFVDFNCEPNKSNDPLPSIKRRTVWGRTSARKNLSMESIDFPSEDEISIQRLEVAKTELQTKIAKEIKGNEILQASLEKRKELLHERRLDLEQDVDKIVQLVQHIKRLEGQLQKEIELRTCLEAGLMNLQPGQLQNKSSIDCKTRADLEELALAEADIENLKQKVTDLCRQLSYQLQHSSSSLCESCSQQLYTMYQSAKETEYSTFMRTKRQQSSTETGEKERALENSNILKGSISASRVDLHDAPANMSASRDKNPDMHAASCNNVTTQNQDLPSSPESHYQQTLQSKTINQGSKSSGPNNISSSEEPVVSGCDTTSNKSSFRGEALKMECASQRSMVSVGLSSASCAEEPTICHNSASKRSSSKNKQNSMIGAHCENEKAQNKDSPSSPDQHSPQKLQPNTINQTCTRSSRPNLVSSIEEPTVFLRSTASKKSSFKGETVKKENPDRQSLTSRQNSQKQQPNTRHQKSMKSGSSNFPLSEETSLNAASKRFSVRSEETAAAASALTRLTSRLNFLKERRVQLANELQNLDASYIVGPDGPPRTSSR